MVSQLHKAAASVVLEALERRLLLSAARIAVIGDFGDDGPAEAAVAGMVAGWDTAAPRPLDAVLTTGDNNYVNGEWSTIDRNIGKHYSRFIGNYQGAYGSGAPVNRFFPSVGNHDWDSTVDHDGDSVTGLDPYLDYFTLPEGTPGNERYYDFVFGSVHVFVIDSDGREPDGRTATSTQAAWLQQRMAASSAAWQVVVTHHPPYASGGADATMRWPYQQWGADLVLAGHSHFYERLASGGLTYVVNGSGGRPLGGFDSIASQSQVRYNADFGAQLIEATDTTLTASFYSAGHLTPGQQLIDRVTLERAPPAPAVQSFVVSDGSGQRSGVRSVTVTFDQAVTVDPGAFTLVGRNGAGVGTTVTPVNPAGDGRTWVLSFGGPTVLGNGGSLSDGIYDLTVVAARVRAAGGAGTVMSADRIFTFHRLFSDRDGDGDSDNADLFEFRSAYGTTAASSSFRWYFDCNADGDVDNEDLLQVRSRRAIAYKGY